MNMLNRTIFDADAIRNTASHDGTISDNRGFSVKTIIIENDLDQEVVLQCRASYDGVNHWFDVGSSFTVAANTPGYQTSDSYFPYMNLTAQCSVSPTSGGLTVYLLGVC